MEDGRRHRRSSGRTSRSAVIDIEYCEPSGRQILLTKIERVRRTPRRAPVRHYHYRRQSTLRSAVVLILQTLFMLFKQFKEISLIFSKKLQLVIRSALKTCYENYDSRLLSKKIIGEGQGAFIFFAKNRAIVARRGFPFLKRIAA